MERPITPGCHRARMDPAAEDDEPIGALRRYHRLCAAVCETLYGLNDLLAAGDLSATFERAVVHRLTDMDDAEDLAVKEARCVRPALAGLETQVDEVRVALPWPCPALPCLAHALPRCAVRRDQAPMPDADSSDKVKFSLYECNGRRECVEVDVPLRPPPDGRLPHVDNTLTSPRALQSAVQDATTIRTIASSPEQVQTLSQPHPRCNAFPYMPPLPSWRAPCPETH